MPARPFLPPACAVRFAVAAPGDGVRHLHARGLALPRILWFLALASGFDRGCPRFGFLYFGLWREPPPNGTGLRTLGQPYAPRLGGLSHLFFLGGGFFYQRLQRKVGTLSTWSLPPTRNKNGSMTPFFWNMTNHF